MKHMLVTIVCLILISSTCEKDDDCHYTISLKNKSDNEIIVGIKVLSSEDKCTIDGVTVNKGEEYDYQPFNFCIEKSLDQDNTLDIYIIDPEKHNDPNEYYDCDSIAYNNTILKLYTLTLEDLIQREFKLSYPE